jgi:ribose/xylose/arabinose/galactoside ABC-type transport system permease subunit
VARSILILGMAIVALGAVLWVIERAGIVPGRLPGDFVWRGKNTTFHFPLASSILASVLLSLLFWLFGRR